MLFNIYINDLLYNLDKNTPSSITISETLSLICLAYAYDILLSKTAFGLQKLLETRDNFCVKWRMEIYNRYIHLTGRLPFNSY